MRYIRNISDDQNKSGDTDNTFRFNLLQGEDIFNFGDYPISINIANSSGYILSMVPEKEFGNSVLKLDFNDQSLKSLTPDNYLLEVEVKFPDGTTATFPTKGGMPFSVNSNLKNTAGKLVPNVTFDEVLSAVDEKVNNYLETVQKGNPGEKGEKGDPGVVDTTKDYTWTGTNTFNKKIIAPAGVQGNADTATKLQTPRKINGTNFDGTSDINVNAANDGSLVHTSGDETVNGNKTFTGIITATQSINGALKTNYVTFTDFASVAANMITYAGMWWTGDNKPINGPFVDTSWSIIEVVAGNTKTTGTIKFTKLISGETWVNTASSGYLTNWQKIAKDATVVHNTGNETINGDKTFTGNNTFTGKTSFWFKQIQWTSGIMQGTWYLQRMGNFVFARFEKSQSTGTGNTSLSLPVGYRPINNWILDAERGQAGINGNGTVYIGTTYNDNTSMTFVYPTNDVWPTA